MIIIPPEDTTQNFPVLFLAGPILGARKWRNEAIPLLDRQALIIANPDRQVWSPEDPNIFTNQVEWETKWLRRAGNAGVVLFYLAREDRSFSSARKIILRVLRGKQLRAHAQTTRFELGEWLVRSPTNIIIGADPDYTGLDYVKTRLKINYPHLSVFSTLRETCQAARHHLDLLG